MIVFKVDSLPNRRLPTDLDAETALIAADSNFEMAYFFGTLSKFVSLLTDKREKMFIHDIKVV